MAINLAALVAALESEYVANLGKLAVMPAADVSSAGRSISTTGIRKLLTDRQKEIEQTLAGLGSPIGTLSVPFAEVSRMLP